MVIIPEIKDGAKSANERFFSLVFLSRQKDDDFTHDHHRYPVLKNIAAFLFGSANRGQTGNSDKIVR